MKEIIFRVNAGFNIGMGHIVRCLNLALYLKTKNIESIFIINPEKTIEKMISDKGFKYFTVESDKEVFELVDKFKDVCLIINDIKDTSYEYMKILKSKGKKIINIDDLGRGTEFADVLIDANRDDLTLSDNNQVCLFGADYIILNPDFLNFYKKEKIINREVKNILLTFGGTDPRNLTDKVLNILKDKVDCNLLTVKSFSNMAESLYNADIAIISGGVTMYESACVGTPAMVVSQVSHQLDNVKRYKDLFIDCGLGHDLNEQFFLEKVEKFIADYELRKKMSFQLKELVDGRGIERLGKIINKQFL